jgi:hypothetical protein
VDGVHHFSKISRLRRTLFDCCLRHDFSILTCCNIYENVAEPKGLKPPLLLLCLCVLTLRRIFPSSPPMSLRALTREIGKHNYSAAQSALLTGEAPSNMQIQTPCLDGGDENKIKTHALASGCRPGVVADAALLAMLLFFPSVLLSRLRKKPVAGISFANGRCE